MNVFFTCIYLVNLGSFLATVFSFHSTDRFKSVITAGGDIILIILILFKVTVIYMYRFKSVLTVYKSVGAD